MGGALKASRSSDARRARLVELCEGLPEVRVERAGSTHLSIKLGKKTLAYYLFDHHGDGRIALCCKAAPGEQSRLVEERPAVFFVPPYLGPKGWVAMRLDTRSVDWAQAAHLLRTAYRLSASARLAARLP